MRHVPTAVAMVIGLLFPLVAVAEDVFTTTSLPTERILRPDSDPHSVVVLLSDAAGWSGKEDAVARAWHGKGAIVVGVDLPAYYDALRRETRDCLYLVSDIERLARQLHRAEAMADYAPPLVTGLGAGGTLALAIAAQTPASTISATLAVDPGAIIPLEKPLCTPAPKTPGPGGIRYGLTPGPLPGAVKVAFTSGGGPDGRGHLAELRKEHPAIEVLDRDGPAAAALETEGLKLLDEGSDDGASLNLPLVELTADARHDTFAIIYSGDGGWRDIDRKLGFFLQKEGVPVVGVDALRYFWSEKPPARTAEDLSRIIAAYGRRFGASRVALIGYSFGANILPATYRLLPETDRARIDLVSLLAPSRHADFEIAVTGWLGIAGAGKYGDPVEDLEMMEPVKLQCIHGKAEKDSACTALGPYADKGAEIIERPGGHHFDGKYQIISDHILARLRPKG